MSISLVFLRTAVPESISNSDTGDNIAS
jgi:hypothetical protein